jgi:hypothetical protein
MIERTPPVYNPTLVPQEIRPVSTPVKRIAHPRFQITLDKRTVKIVEELRKTRLKGETRSGAIRWMIRYYGEAAARRARRLGNP